MAGYLAHYGEGDEKREKRIHRLVTVGVIIATVLGLYLLTFKTPILERYIRVVQIIKNHAAEKRVDQFLALLGKQDYKGAYALWGCTDAKPCRDYTFQSFMEDWGPKTAQPAGETFQTTKSRSCGSGVILTVNSAKREEKLWVEREDLNLSFSPYPGCPAGL
jgi:hypothetical protein